MLTAAVEKTPKPSLPSFRQPPVEIGQIVWWYPSLIPSDNSPPTAAIVVGVGIETINVQVVGEFANKLFRDGVRHRDDPRNGRQLDSDRGTWEHTTEHKRLIALEELIAKDALQRQYSPPPGKVETGSELSKKVNEAAYSQEVVDSSKAALSAKAK